MSEPPEGYLGARTHLRHGPAQELVESGYALEIADAPLLHRDLTLADLAHLVALREAEIIPGTPAGQLLVALLDVLDMPAEQFPYDPLYGDAYNSRERYLQGLLGDVAGWLHTGRTRREAGRVAFRLAARGRVLALQRAVVSFVRALCDRACQHASTVWNDTTYLQPAQPSTFGHYLLGFATEGRRHLDRLEAVRAWLDRSPAGVGGVGGTRLPLDRTRLADLLGFERPGDHTRDAMWSIDGMVDAGVAAAQTVATVDRLAEDLEILTSPQFDAVELDASVCRASVLLPQKRNPYALAVIRGGASTLVGRATGLLTTQRTPSARTDNWLHAYGEVADSLDLARRLTALGATVIATLRVHVDRLESEAGSQFTCATDLAEELVRQGRLDYRTAYHLVAARVAAAREAGRTAFHREDVDGLIAAAEARGAAVDHDAVLAAADPARVVETRTAPGAASPSRVVEDVEALAADLDGWQRHLDTVNQRHEDAEAHLVDHARARAAASGDPRS